MTGLRLCPQGVRELPQVQRRGAAILLPGAQTGLLLPPGVRRVVIFSNVPGVDARTVLKPGDWVVHINRARYFTAVRDIPGVAHTLVVRRGRDHRTGRMVWYEPPSTAGFSQVLRVRDVPMRSHRRWWQEYCREHPGKCPTTGFICWHLAREAAPGLPMMLVGFNPGTDCGTYRWPGHDWEYEAYFYAHEGILSKDSSDETISSRCF